MHNMVCNKLIGDKLYLIYKFIYKNDRRGNAPNYYFAITKIRARQSTYN